MLKINNFLGRESKDKGIFFSHFFYDLNIGTIHCTKRWCTIKHKFHISGSGSFFTCRRNLLRYIRCRKNNLSITYTIVFNKHYFNLSANAGIIIYYIRNTVDQFDNRFCTTVSGRSLCTKDKGMFYHIHLRMLFQLIIQIHYMQNIKQLTFVLMKALYLYIKDGIWIHFNAVVLLDIICQTNFILIFDIHKLFQSTLIFCIRCKFTNFRQICDPTFSNSS